MLEPGSYTLGDLALTTAGSYLGDPVTDLDGMLAASVQLRLAYGSAGGTGKAYVQTTFDQGTTWVDVACMTFSTAAKSILYNFDATLAAVVDSLGDGVLADDTALDGPLGDQLRLKVITSGTAYAGQTVLSGRLVAR